jgi:hypothetical protein
MNTQPDNKIQSGKSGVSILRLAPQRDRAQHRLRTTAAYIFEQTVKQK